MLAAAVGTHEAGDPFDGYRYRTRHRSSWRNDQSYATSTSWLGYDAGVRYYTNGFRVARDLE